MTDKKFDSSRAGVEPLGVGGFDSDHAPPPRVVDVLLAVDGDQLVTVNGGS